MGLNKVKVSMDVCQMFGMFFEFGKNCHSTIWRVSMGNKEEVFFYLRCISIFARVIFDIYICQIVTSNQTLLS